MGASARYIVSFHFLFIGFAFGVRLAFGLGVFLALPRVSTCFLASFRVGGSFAFDADAGMPLEEELAVTRGELITLSAIFILAFKQSMCLRFRTSGIGDVINLIRLELRRYLRGPHLIRPM